MSEDLPALNTSLVLPDQAPQQKGKRAKPPAHWFKLATALIEKCEGNVAPKYHYEILLSAWTGRDSLILIEDCFERDYEEEFYLCGAGTTSWDVDRSFKFLNHDASEIMRDMRAVWPGFNVFSLSRSFISARLKRMISTVSGARLSLDYADMLINYVEMQKPCALALETACRELEQTVKKLPTPGDVLPVLKKHSDKWGPRIKVIKAWNDGTIKKMAEETLIALRKRERIHLKQVAACLEDAGHGDIAKKLLAEKPVDDSEWRTVRELLCPPDLKELFASRRKTKRTAVCERARAKYKWSKQTKRRHAMAYHMEALGKLPGISDKLRSDQYVKLAAWEMEQAENFSKTFRTTLDRLTIDGFPGLATKLQARQFADLTDKEKERFRRYAAMSYEAWAFDNENLHGGDRALRAAQERFFYHHLDHADDCNCPACRTKRWIAEEHHNEGRGSTHTSKRRQSVCVNASDDDDFEWEQGSS